MCRFSPASNAPRHDDDGDVKDLCFRMTIATAAAAAARVRFFSKSRFSFSLQPSSPPVLFLFHHKIIYTIEIKKPKNR